MELALKARDALSNGRLAVDRLTKALETASAKDRASLEEIQKALVAAPIRYSRPMIVDQIEYLYENLDTADQRPGRDAYLRYEELRPAPGADREARSNRGGDRRRGSRSLSRYCT